MDFTNKNIQIIKGNVGKDPEVKPVGTNGNTICKLSIPVKITGKKFNSDETFERTEWFNVDMFRPKDGYAHDIAHFIDNVGKGDFVFIQGETTTTSTGQGDQKRQFRSVKVDSMNPDHCARIIFKKGPGQNQGGAPPQGNYQQPQGDPTGSNDHDDDDLPF